MSPLVLVLVVLLGTAVLVSVVVVTAAGYLKLGDWRRQRRARDEAQARMAELAALPAPDAIAAAPDPTRSQRRAHTRRDHPIAHKRDGRGW